MSLKPWTAISRLQVIKNPWWTYCRDAVGLPSGKEGEYHYVHSLGSSLVIPVLDDGHLLLVNQYRYLGGKESLEFPCGAVKEGSTHDQTARHELEEETGYSAGKMALAGRFNPYNGVTDEICHVYVARDLRHVGGTPDETEEFELVSMGAEQISQFIMNGTIWDGMTIAAWALAQRAV
jgi:ADP-ribose pyrophosphatase